MFLQKYWITNRYIITLLNLSLYTFFFFISLFLSMSVKYIKSPTYLVFLCLKKRRKIKEIIKFLKPIKLLKLEFQI